MTQGDFLTWLAQSLTTAGVPFMVVGSLCSSYHGEPRSTQDADLVIDPSPAQLDRFLALVSDPVYVSLEAARNALRTRHQFNIIDSTGGWKADLMIRKERAFDVEEFQRRQTVNWHGIPITMATAEDVILAKLEWAKTTPSERQLQDALNVAIARRAHLDQIYMRKWARALGVSDQLEAILQQAGSAPT